MKVLHLIGGGDVGGAKSHVLSLVRELGKYIEVKLVCFRQGAFADDARSMGINVEVIQTGSIVGDVRRVVRIVQEEGYEIIHSHGAKANMVSVISSRFVKVATVTTVHSDYRLDYLQNKYKMFSFGLINTIALRFVQYHIAVSMTFKKMLVKRKFKENNIFTVYNGIDFSTPVGTGTRSDFCTKYRISLSEEDVVAGILARLDPVKGINTFLLAAKEVLAKHPEAKFIIGGDGDERKALENKAAALGITNNVFFIGWVDDMYEFMRNIDINVLTSLSESFPYVILEGTLLKRVTVSSNVGGIADLIEDGETGFLFEPGDYKKLAEHIIKLVEDKTLREQMGEKVYEKAKREFSLENMCRTQREIYEKILENKGVNHA